MTPQAAEKLKARINEACTQDLDDIMGSARLCMSEKSSSVFVEMFCAGVGRLYCEPGATFLDAYSAYRANQNDHPMVLAFVAEELERRHPI